MTHNGGSSRICRAHKAISFGRFDSVTVFFFIFFISRPKGDSGRCWVQCYSWEGCVILSRSSLWFWARGFSVLTQHVQHEQKCWLNWGLYGTSAHLNQKSEHLYELLLDKRSTLEWMVGVSTNSPSKNGYMSTCRRLEEPVLLTELCLLNVAKWCMITFPQVTCLFLLPVLCTSSHHFSQSSVLNATGSLLLISLAERVTLESLLRQLWSHFGDKLALSQTRASASN